MERGRSVESWVPAEAATGLETHFVDRSHGAAQLPGLYQDQSALSWLCLLLSYLAVPPGQEGLKSDYPLQGFL